MSEDVPLRDDTRRIAQVNTICIGEKARPCATYRIAMQHESGSDRLKRARELAGYSSAADFAAQNKFPDPTYRSHENGTRDLTIRAAKLYAAKLNTTWLYLMEGGENAPQPAPAKPRNRPSPDNQNYAPLGSADRIKVLGMAECGPDGWSLWNGEVIDTVPRPQNLIGARDAYAVFITGSSMENRYYPGEVVFIHPGKPVTTGAFVLVQIKPPEDGEIPRAVIKRLTKKTGNKVVLEQFNPPKTFTLTTSEIVSIHRVVGSGEA